MYILGNNRSQSFQLVTLNMPRSYLFSEAYLKLWAKGQHVNKQDALALTHIKSTCFQPACIINRVVDCYGTYLKEEV